MTEFLHAFYKRTYKYIITLTLFTFGLLAGKLLIFSTNASEYTRNSGEYLLNHSNVIAVEMPTEASFAGEKVPLEDFDVYERLDRELLVNTYFQSQTILLHKRAARWLPVINPILKAYGIPEDFKYIPLIETGLMHSTSPAGAVGFWQFLEPTAKQYGLEVNSEIDERYHVEKSTAAACKFFKEAYRTLGNWSLVAAAYNMGITGVKKQVDKQGSQNYYDLLLNTETSRYLFRAIAVKEVIEHPEKYGYTIRKKDLYPLLETYKINVDSSITDLYAFAKQQKVNYKILKLCNPWLREGYLKNPERKNYLIDLPKRVDLYKELLEDELRGQIRLLPLEENESISLEKTSSDTLVAEESADKKVLPIGKRNESGKSMTALNFNTPLEKVEPAVIPLAGHSAPTKEDQQ